MTTYHEFNKDQIDASLKKMSQHHDHNKLLNSGIGGNLADNGHISFAAAECISVTVENGKVCINLPLGIGKVCLPIPSIIPNGTAAKACLDICTTFGIPTGVKVTISALGRVIVTKSFGKC